MKRNREGLATELNLWEGYLQKVVYDHTCAQACGDTMLTVVFLSFDFCIKVAAGSYLAGGFSLADVIVFPNIAYAFRFG